MKWREPWRNTLRRQEPWRPLTLSHLKSATIWTLVLLAVGGMRAYSSDVSMTDFAGRMWFAPAIGTPLALLLSIGHWLSPLKVDSGPNGIVRSKSEALALVPWKSMKSFRIYELHGERVLELTVSYTTERERFYLSDKTDVAAVEMELLANGVRADAVGTGITPRPPHRSVRAELPHTAPASGNDDQPPPK